MTNTKLNKINDIKIFALGGLGEVGKNTYVIEYLNQIFVIDAGILFPDEHLLGVDYVINDYQYLIDNQEKIVGLFITHGHEDHIGGIPFLLKQVKIDKIYAAGVAVDLIENKISEHRDLHPTIVEFKSHFVYNFKGIDVSFIRMNHSIPDCFAIVFKTAEGNIIHTGDFKIDFTPVGANAEYDKLTSLGNEGVLCLLADSTNAMLEGFTQSERKIGNSIRDLFSQIKHRIIVATFASNMYRVQQVVEASVENKRKIAIFGRSMEKTIEIGQECGYIKAPKGTFIEPHEINNYLAEELTLLCTGSQGEPMAALSRVANGSHRHIKLIPNDTVIFSSSPIPGNAEGVHRTINLLFKHGANVIIHSPITDTHTSGHASSGELKMIQAFLRPKFFMPIHGEYRMLKTHAQLAVECGCKKENTFVMENGDVLSINRNSASITGKVRAGDVYVDGSRIGDISNSIIKERKTLSDDGLFGIIITINVLEKTLPVEPQVVSRGFIYMKDNEKITQKFIAYAKQFVLNEITKVKQINLTNLKFSLADQLGRFIQDETDRSPVILPIFMPV